MARLKAGPAALWVALALAVLSPSQVGAEEGVDLELVLLADGSRSIDGGELRFQREGYALAMQDPTVLEAIGQGYYRRIAVTYVEWGGSESQVVAVPWMLVDGGDTAAVFARTLRAAEERPHGSNAIGTAIAFAHTLIETNDFDAARRVIDFSGDSANNLTGMPVAPARAAALEDGITINGLAVLCYSCNGPPVSYDLVSAFERTITGGPGSFVLSADDETQFVDAVRRKLVLEIAGLTPAAAERRLARIPEPGRP